MLEPVTETATFQQGSTLCRCHCEIWNHSNKRETKYDQLYNENNYKWKSETEGNTTASSSLYVRSGVARASPLLRLPQGADWGSTRARRAKTKHVYFLYSTLK